MTDEDERAFLLFLSRFEFEIYPVRVPPDWKPLPANEKAASQLPPESFYLAASKVGPVVVDRVKRGPLKGHWRVDEVRSPVVFFGRSALNEAGELLSGNMWAELDVTPQTGRQNAAPDHFRSLYLQIEEWLKKTFRKGNPIGFLVGPHAARRSKGGLILRDAAPRGKTVLPYR